MGLGVRFHGAGDERKISIYRSSNQYSDKIQAVMSRKRKNREEPESGLDKKALDDAIISRVKLLDPCSKIEESLCRTLDPPGFESIQNAIGVLQEIGALSADEHLTQLGEKLGTLPVHPSTGRMLIFSLLMDSLGPA